MHNTGPPAPRPASRDAGASPAPSPTLPAATTGPQLSAPAAARTTAAALEVVVDCHALLVTNAAGGRPAGVEVDGSDSWRGLLDLGPVGHVAGRRDAPVEVG